MAASGSKPPFATATLARLYLAQGHFETAANIARTVAAEGGAQAGAVQEEVSRAAEGRAKMLEELLDTVRRRRRANFGTQQRRAVSGLGRHGTD